LFRQTVVLLADIAVRLMSLQKAAVRRSDNGRYLVAKAAFPSGLAGASFSSFELLYASNSWQATGIAQNHRWCANGRIDAARKASAHGGFAHQAAGLSSSHPWPARRRTDPAFARNASPQRQRRCASRAPYLQLRGTDAYRSATHSMPIVADSRHPATSRNPNYSWSEDSDLDAFVASPEMT
jgi:hypothetical protein